MAASAGVRKRSTKSSSKPARFDKKLVLNKWMLKHFNVEEFAEFAVWLQDGDEGFNDDGTHKFFGVLEAKLRNQGSLLADLLRVYEDNIARHTKRINDSRRIVGEDEITWKYFQYLTLLFTEIYLDQYFSKPEELLQGINGQIAEWNAAATQEADQVTPYPAGGRAWEQLNKVAYWSATGSGKTLLMHVNVLQYHHYLDLHGGGKSDGRELNRIILLTPNEGLSLQHLREFEASGINAEIFSKGPSGLDLGPVVEIIDINKLSDSAKDGADTKTVSPDAFESNNLVLIDEGHRGASGASWMDYRNRLCATGFSFEYSATFGQAVKSSPALADQYAKNILVDYSYRYFYNDGFGKNYQILNIDESAQSRHEQLYLTGCLLAFYQQLRLFADQGEKLKPFNVEKPLWVFVGGSVTKSVGKKDISDILAILKFLDRFVTSPDSSRKDLATLLEAGLVDANGRDVFAGRFDYLRSLGNDANETWNGILDSVFNAASGGRLTVRNLKGIDGEISLQLGQNDAFGVINVGDDAKLITLCEDAGLATGETAYSNSLFNHLNDAFSRITLLIGSRKFTEGWSSWRVSTMGLMNIGKSEGAQIIQLFGRGVRLKGYDLSLKRGTPHAGGYRFLDYLQTLNIFGVHADYMAQFREYLEDEGLPVGGTSVVRVPVSKHPVISAGELFIVDLEEDVGGVRLDFGDAFRKKGPVPTLTGLSAPDGTVRKQLSDYFVASRVTVNLYPKLQSMVAAQLRTGGDVSIVDEGKLQSGHLAFLNFDQLYFELEQLKAERGWSNFNIPASEIPLILSDPSWYTLYVPKRELAFDSFERVRLWQEVATTILRKYAERFYRFSKQAWEANHLEYRVLPPDHANLMGVADDSDDSFYRILIPEEAEHAGALAKFEDLGAVIRNDAAIPKASIEGVRALAFSQHLYEPLLCVDKSVIQVSPTPLNVGESRFMEDLSAFWMVQRETFFADKRLYALRNLSRGKGVGFFEAGSFYPDFILWLLVNDVQHIIFVDPKGIGRMSKDHAKLNFGSTIRHVEASIRGRGGEAAERVRLHSFIVSNTQFSDLTNGASKEELTEKNVLFQVDDAETYIGDLFSKVLSDATD